MCEDDRIFTEIEMVQHVTPSGTTAVVVEQLVESLNSRVSAVGWDPLERIEVIVDTNTGITLPERAKNWSAHSRR